MYHHTKIFNYSHPESFTGTYNKKDNLYYFEKTNGDVVHSDNYIDFMNEDKGSFLGFGTQDWWKAFPKYRFKDLGEVNVFYRDFIIHPKLKKYVEKQEVELVCDGYDVQLTQSFENDDNFDAFNETCQSEDISHGFIYYPLGSVFR